MKANEFRIGNILYSNLTEINFACTSEDIYNLSMDYNANNANYIELTEEWLLKFGFVKTNDSLLFLPIAKIKSELHYEIHDYGNTLTLHSDFGMFIPNDIEYVHQLQNLYFALTGEELTIK